MTRDLDRLEELAQAAYDLVPYREGTGWHWAGDVSGGYPRLALSAWISGRGRCTVMDFERWGMQSAGPRFPDDAMMMHDARKMVIFEVGRRGVVGQKAAEADDSVYRYDVDGVDHPIPEFIAAADPSTVLALIAEIRRLQEGSTCCHGQTAEDLCNAYPSMGEIKQMRDEVTRLRETVGLLHGWEDRAKKAEAHVADLATDAEQHRARAEAAEAEAMNNGQDYDRRGERLWRLAANAGWMPGNPADNDATAELYISDALNTAEATIARVAALADSVEHRMMATAKPSEIRDALNDTGVTNPTGRTTATNGPESALGLPNAPGDASSDPRHAAGLTGAEIADTTHYLAICTDDGEPRLTLVCTAAPGADCRKRPKDANEREGWYMDDPDIEWVDGPCWAVEYAEDGGWETVQCEEGASFPRIPVSVVYDEGPVIAPIAPHPLLPLGDSRTYLPPEGREGL